MPMFDMSELQNKIHQKDHGLSDHISAVGGDMQAEARETAEAPKGGRIADLRRCCAISCATNNSHVCAGQNQQRFALFWGAAYGRHLPNRLGDATPLRVRPA